jgi:acyl carrier protein
VELIFQLEKHFGLEIKIDSIDLDDLRSLSRIARLVAANGAAFAPSAARTSSGADN